MTTLADMEELAALRHGIHGLEYVIEKARGIEGAPELDALRKQWEHSLKVLREMADTYAGS